MSEQEQKLRDEILNDAKRKAERTVSRARREAEKAHEQAADEQRAEREQALARVAERADARCRAILATVSQEVRQRRLRAREDIIERCLDEALALAAGLSGEEAKESLRGLLAEALQALGPGEAVIRLRAEDASLLSAEFLSSLGADPATLTVKADETIGGGVVVESADGRRQFDNTYATRRERLRERLRTLLAGGIEF
jgi:vacuolar-type H+-ATPase subunit E/Vma4